MFANFGDWVPPPSKNGIQVPGGSEPKAPSELSAGFSFVSDLRNMAEMAAALGAPRAQPALPSHDRAGHRLLRRDAHGRHSAAAAAGRLYDGHADLHHPLDGPLQCHHAHRRRFF